MYIDDDQTIYVADTENHRIVEWKSDTINGQIVAGGNEKGNRNDQLDYPTKMIVDNRGYTKQKLDNFKMFVKFTFPSQ